MDQAPAGGGGSARDPEAIGGGPAPEAELATAKALLAGVEQMAGFDDEVKQCEERIAILEKQIHEVKHGDAGVMDQAPA